MNVLATSLEPHRSSAVEAVLGSGPPSHFVALFGSAARNELRADSDLDLAWLPTDPGVPLDQELRFQAELTLAAGREVDLVRVDRTSTLVRMEVARSGVVVQGDPSAWIRFRAEAIGEFLDFEPALRDASRRFLRSLRNTPSRGST